MTISVRLPPELEIALRQRLESHDLVISDFIREAIQEKLNRTPDSKPSAYELWKEHFKGWSSGQSDRAERVEEILREKYRAEREKRRR